MSDLHDDGDASNRAKAQPKAHTPERGAAQKPKDTARPMFQSTVEAEPSRLGRVAIAVLVGGVVVAGAVFMIRRFRAEPPAPVPPTVEQPVLEGPGPEGPPLPEGAMVRVEGGIFQMGSNSGDPDEKPVTETHVDTFEIDTTEVTVNAYRSCVEAGKCTPPDAGRDACNWGKSGYERHPVNCVDWQQASDFCASFGKRLPTEAEWEYAARGSDGRVYPWKDGLPSSQLCWNGEGNDLGKDKRQGTCAVGRFAAGASPFGALDMAGNVWEWTANAYCPYGGGACTDERRVIRGGGWNNVVSVYVRAQDRSKEAAGSRNDNVGFRCARSPK